MDKFDECCKKEGDCIVWTRGKDPLGYGMVRTPAGKKRSHRYAYERAFGEIPEGKIVVHTCGRFDCVNPAHLFLSTQAENLRARMARDEAV